MPSTAASHMIFFIAAVMVSVAIVGTLISTTYKFSDDIESRGNNLSDRILTEISIENDEVAMPYNSSNNTLTLYLLNIGSTIININNTSIIVLINGTYYDNLTFVIPGGVNYWKPKTMLTVVVGDVTLPAADHRLKVVVQGGAYDTLEFRIT